MRRRSRRRLVETARARRRQGPRAIGPLWYSGRSQRLAANTQQQLHKARRRRATSLHHLKWDPLDDAGTSPGRALVKRGGARSAAGESASRTLARARGRAPRPARRRRAPLYQKRRPRAARRAPRASASRPWAAAHLSSAGQPRRRRCLRPVRRPLRRFRRLLCGFCAHSSADWPQIDFPVLCCHRGIRYRTVPIPYLAGNKQSSCVTYCAAKTRIVPSANAGDPPDKMPDKLRPTDSEVLDYSPDSIY